MKTECEHKNRKNLYSYCVQLYTNVLEVECIDCGMHRHETRYKNGRVDCSEWFKPRKEKTK